MTRLLAGFPNRATFIKEANISRMSNRKRTRGISMELLNVHHIFDTYVHCAVINYRGNSWIIAYFTRPFSEHEEPCCGSLNLHNLLTACEIWIPSNYSQYGWYNFNFCLHSSRRLVSSIAQSVECKIYDNIHKLMQLSYLRNINWQLFL